MKLVLNYMVSNREDNSKIKKPDLVFQHNFNSHTSQQQQSTENKVVLESISVSHIAHCAGNMQSA